jgi:hypothetical protein
VELYAEHWEFLAPRYILDRRLGYLWELKVDRWRLCNSSSCRSLCDAPALYIRCVCGCVWMLCLFVLCTFCIYCLCVFLYILDGLCFIQLNLVSLSSSFTNKLKLFKFLVRRTGSKAVLLRSLCELVQDGGHLSVLAPIFDLLTEILADQPSAHVEKLSPVGDGVDMCCLCVFFAMLPRLSATHAYPPDEHMRTHPNTRHLLLFAPALLVRETAPSFHSPISGGTTSVRLGWWPEWHCGGVARQHERRVFICWSFGTLFAGA